MSKKPKRVQHVEERIVRYAEELERMREEVGHWDTKVDMALRAAVRALGLAQEPLINWPANVAPARKPPTRRYTKIRVGDQVSIAKVYQKRTPAVIRTSTFPVVAIDGDDIVQVEHDGVRYGVERRFLMPAPAGSAP